MKKFFWSLCALFLFLGVAGCGGSNEPVNIAEGAEQSEIEKFEAMQKADQAEQAAATADASTGKSR